MTDKTRTIKIRANTYRRLKIAAAQCGMTMLDLIDQLVMSVDTREQDNEQPTHHPTDSTPGR
jgi:hypothetical protein